MLLQEALEALNGNKRPGKHSTGGTGEPWYTSKAIALLDELLYADFRAWEFGSGASTIWIAKRVAHLTTVEHVDHWAERVQTAVDLSEMTDKVTILYRELGKGYAETINACEDGSLDALFIDGRERVASLRNGLPKLKSGGIVCIDNTEREHYQEGFDLMDGWPVTETENEKWKTTIWVKP